jgi:DNA-binding MarR family transcriptional regulator
MVPGFDAEAAPLTPASRRACRHVRAKRGGFGLISYFLVDDANRLDTGNLGFLLAKASQRWNELLAAGFAAHGFGEVRPSYGSVLLPLFEQDGLRMGQIAERAGLSKQTMTTLVRLCERDGLVVRERDPRDARAFRIKLTKRAKDFRPVAGEVLRALDIKVLDALGERHRNALARALKGMMEL